MDWMAEEFGRLRAPAADVVGFHELLHGGHVEGTPLQRMIWEVHLTSAALELAIGVHRIADRLSGEFDR